MNRIKSYPDYLKKPWGIAPLPILRNKVSSSDMDHYEILMADSA